MIYRITDRTGFAYGTFAGDFPSEALHSFALAKGFDTTALLLEWLYGDEFREWLISRVKPHSSHIEGWMHEAFDKLAQCADEQTDLSFEVAGRYTASGTPECFRRSLDLIATPVSEDR